MLLDLELVAKALGARVKDMLEPITARIVALEAKAPIAGPAGEQGEKGERGADATVPDLYAIATQVIEMLPAPKDGAVGPAGKDGIDGVNGKDAEIDIDAVVLQAVERAQKSIAAVVPQMIADAVQKAVAALPTAKDGRDGLDGKDGKDGRDGVGMAGAFLGKSGDLVLTLTDGSVRELGIVQGEKGADGRDGDRGADGTNGKDGLDGFGFDDLAVEHDGERGFVFTFTKGERVKTFGPFTIPGVLYRGIWDSAHGAYDEADAVTFAGSLWIAKEATTAKPGDTAEAARAWKLAVKRGADGKQGPVGPVGPQGVKGIDGKDIVRR